MRRKSHWPYLLILGALLLLLSIPRYASEKVQGTAVSLFSPIWEGLSNSKNFVVRLFSSSSVQMSSDDPSLTLIDEINHLKLQNHHLLNELDQLESLFLNEIELNNELNELHQKHTKSSTAISQRHLENMQRLFQQRLQALPARVIYRPPSTWHSSLWINVGENDNQRLNQNILVKNSPVVVGTSVIGVIDYVGKNQSRVRLITDSGLTPSVRAVRGASQNHRLQEKITRLIDSLMARPDLFDQPKEKKDFLEKLENLVNRLQSYQTTLYLAKGELRGSSQPLWRVSGQTLKGTGFNYDFDDEDGPARDLRTGKPLEGPHRNIGTPLIKMNDLLVTTGLDGVFPPGLSVGEVTNIHMLKEGDYYYELEATPTVGDLNELSLVYVLPHYGYDPQDLPTPMGWR